MDDFKIKSNFEPLGASLKVSKPKEPSEGVSFADTLADSLGEVNKLQIKADNAIEDLVTGKTKNIHETMINLSKADVAFKLTMQVRNKVIDAYKEIMNTAM